MYRPGTQTRNQRTASRESDEQVITNAAPLPFPLEAKIDETGEAVTLLQTCDWKGHSPSNVGLDKQGKQFIAAFEEVTVTDHRVIPNEQANNVRSRNGQ